MIAQAGQSDVLGCMFFDYGSLWFVCRANVYCYFLSVVSFIIFSSKLSSFYFCLPYLNYSLNWVWTMYDLTALLLYLVTFFIRL